MQHVFHKLKKKSSLILLLIVISIICVGFTKLFRFNLKNNNSHFEDNSENNKTYLSPRVNGSRMKIYFNRFGIAKLTMNMFHQIEIENVHTLQNIFFALYGSELVFSTEL